MLDLSFPLVCVLTVHRLFATERTKEKSHELTVVKRKATKLEQQLQNSKVQTNTCQAQFTCASSRLVIFALILLLSCSPLSSLSLLSPLSSLLSPLSCSPLPSSLTPLLFSSSPYLSFFLYRSFLMLFFISAPYFEPC